VVFKACNKSGDRFKYFKVISKNGEAEQKMEKQLKYSPTAVVIDDFLIDNLLDKDFMEILHKHLPKVHIQHICLKLVDENEEKVIEDLMIGHEKLSDEKKKSLFVGSDTHTTLDLLLITLKEYLSRK
jgi:hypothetical protein